MQEEWKEIPGYEGLYEVSTSGRVRSLRQGTRIKDKESRIMMQKRDNHGYFRVNLYKGGKCKAELVSRLVALAFVENPKGYKEVGHDDDNKENNSVENLYWTDRKENLTHNGLHLRIRDLRQKNIQKVVDALAIPVIATNVKTGESIRYASMQEAARHGFESGKISLCCAGKRITHRGYTWRKEQEL